VAVDYERAGHIVTITLNRPRVLNAFNREMHRELNESFRRFREDEDARVAIVTGAGERAFSSGQDLKELDTMLADSEPVPNLWTAYFGDDLQSGLDVWKPVIAAIRGYCIGEGLCLALACDVRVAGEGATFSFPEVELGLPTITGAIRAAELLGLGHALELLLLGEKHGAGWAYRTGLVNVVESDDDVLAKARTWAERLAGLDPAAVRATKEMARRSRGMSLPDAVRMGEAMRRIAMGGK
jgi:enoyl-CoA hydratase/carnithine racemase